MSFKTKTHSGNPKGLNLLLCFSVVLLVLVFVPSFATSQSATSQSTTTRNRVRQALVVRRQRPLVSTDTSSTNNSTNDNSEKDISTNDNSEKDQEEIVSDENEERQLSKPQTNGRKSLFDFLIINPIQ